MDRNASAAVGIAPDLLDNVIRYVEKLAACVFLAFCGGAMARFADVATPFWPTLGVVLGLGIVASSIFLALWLGTNAVMRLRAV